MRDLMASLRQSTHLELCYCVGGHGIEGDQDGQLLGSPGIAQRMREDEGAYSLASARTVRLEKLRERSKLDGPGR